MLNAMEYVYYAYALVGLVCGGSLVVALYLSRKKTYHEISSKKPGRRTQITPPPPTSTITPSTSTHIRP